MSIQKMYRAMFVNRFLACLSMSGLLVLPNGAVSAHSNEYLMTITGPHGGMVPMADALQDCLAVTMKGQSPPLVRYVLNEQTHIDLMPAPAPRRAPDVQGGKDRHGSRMANPRYIRVNTP